MPTKKFAQFMTKPQHDRAGRRRPVLSVVRHAVLQLMAACFVAHGVWAASLQEVQGFGNNPSNARMFVYVPDKLAASPPILVAIHYCGGNANAYFTGTGYRGLADRYGFIVIYPQTTSSDGCFDVHSEATLKHDGGSDSAAIAAMVRYSITKYSANANRVYVTGTSSGAMMTNVMLGAYPDLFRAGAAFAGVPYACFAGQGGWNSACATGQTTKTGQQWGDLVRAAYPGYTGPRPRVQLWHGNQDETLNFHNFGEEIKEWTNVLGVGEAPTSTEQNTPQSGWTRTRYADSSGVVQVEAVLEAGMTHNLTVPVNEVARFFGLDAAADPAPAAGSGGAAGSAGNSSAGSSAGAGHSGSPAGNSAGVGVGPGGAGIAGRAAPSGGTGGAAGRSSAAGTPVVGAAAGVGVAGGPVVTGSAGVAVAMPPSAAVVGQGGSTATGVVGAGAQPQSMSSSGSCSVQAGGSRSSSATWLMFVAAAVFCSCRRFTPRARQPLRQGAA